MTLVARLCAAVALPQQFVVCAAGPLLLSALPGNSFILWLVVLSTHVQAWLLKITGSTKNAYISLGIREERR